MNFIQQFDATIFNFFNHTLAAGWLDYIMVVVTQLGNIVPAGILMLFLLRHTFTKQNFCHWLAIAIPLAIIGGLVRPVKKFVINRPRPYVSADYLGEPVRLVNEILSKYSMPSGHTFTAFAVATILAVFRPKMAPAAYFVACLVGISRMYLAAHFPTDVLAGATSAILTILIGELVWRKFFKSQD